MNKRSGCKCLLCELEQTLVEELSGPRGLQGFQNLASQSGILSRFPDTSDLLQQLHRNEGADNNESFADEILGELVRLSDGDCRDLSHRLQLLALMPALHKTSRILAMRFPSLAREDIAQHLLTAMLEILQSKGLRTRQSHFAFAIARSLRRNSFRWAIREARNIPTEDAEDTCDFLVLVYSDDGLEAGIQLRAFLHRCLCDQLLTKKEYELLILFKLNEVPAETLAAREGLSEGAFRHRMLRLIERLRRVARGLTRKGPKPIAETSESPLRKNSVA